MNIEKSSDPLSSTATMTVASSPEPSSGYHADKPSRKSYPMIAHVAFLSALAVPFIALPYFIMGRRLIPLRGKLQALETQNQRLRNDLEMARSAQRSTISEIRYLQTTLDKLLNRLSALQKQSSRHAAELTEAHNALTNVQGQVDGVQKSRDSDIAALHALGMSLAEVAAFMQEIERNLGLETSIQNKDQRGIERLRLLALQIQATSQKLDT